MGMSLIDYSVLPSGMRVAGPPAVIVRDNGQVSMSASAAKALVGCTVVMIGADLEAVKAGKPVQVQFQGLPSEPKGKEGKGRPISRGKEGKNCTISMSSALKTVLGYDFKTAGNQTFQCQANEAKHVISFVLPAETPKAKPKVTRTRKPKAPATAPAKEAAKPVEEAAEAVTEEDLQF